MTILGSISVDNWKVIIYLEIIWVITTITKLVTPTELENFTNNLVFSNTIQCSH